MSYSRLGADSDVYVIDSGDDEEQVLICICCQLSDGPLKDFRCSTTSEMIGHLQLHMDHGHQVPVDALERLRLDDRDFA